MTNASNPSPNDPLDFVTNLWSNMGFSLPGMVAPTVDTDELGKRIADLKAVEGWLKSNLNLLQMTIQGLEMQRATLMAFQQTAQPTSEAPKQEETAANFFFNPSAWQMTWESMKSAVSPAPNPEVAAASEPAKAKRSRRKKSQPQG